MDTISGIPAHPLFVHIPAVLLPLAALGVVVMLIKKAWFERYKWAVLVVSGLGALGAILAAGSGESLEEGVEGSGKSIEAHAEAGEAARTLGILFFIVVAAAIFVPIFLERRAKGDAAKAAPAWLRPATAALLLISAGASVVTVIDAGHSGAESVWAKVQLDGGDDDDD